MEILIHTENDEIVVNIEGSGLPYKVGDTIYLNIDDDGKITRGDYSVDEIHHEIIYQNFRGKESAWLRVNLDVRKVY